MAINPENFASGFGDRMSELLAIQRNMTPVSRCCSAPSDLCVSVVVLVGNAPWRPPQADPDHPVLAAGDPERSNMEKCDELGGIPYHINVVNYMVGTGSDVTPRKTPLCCVSDDILPLQDIHAPLKCTSK